jgi:hypothetical protein
MEHHPIRLFAWFSLLPRLNSLFFEKNSLIRVWEFPVRLRREFSWKPLNSRADWTPKSRQRGQILQISLLISLLAGNLLRRLVRS